MPRFNVTPHCGGFSCEHGGVTPEDDGTFVIENGNIIAAMVQHGFTLTEAVGADPTEAAKAVKAAKAAKAAKSAPAPAEPEPAVTNGDLVFTDAAALEAAEKAILGDAAAGAQG